MKINEVISFLEKQAHPSSLDATEEVIQEAIAKKCNLVVAHHPIVFGGLKKINGKNYVEKTIIAAIKNDIAIYAIHTNLDNIISGVNGKIASMLGLQQLRILLPKENTLKKLFTFVPVEKATEVRQAIFMAGGGHIGNYSECSFNAEGTGTFKAGAATNPFVGTIGEQHKEKEVKIEIIFPAWLEGKLVAALRQAHPYEEVAYDVVNMANANNSIGAGIIGFLPNPLTETAFLTKLKEVFKVPVVRHTLFTGRPVHQVALCGGAGSFLISKALAAGADAFVTADLKYHEFFDANGRTLLADIGHYESEQFTINLLQEILEQNFPTFAVLKTEVKTNPVQYFG
jgi:dinuclear metal center YbgI/SA1388 family protein